MSTADLITPLCAQLAFCLSKDRHRLKRQLDILRRNKKTDARAVDALRVQLEKSSAQYEKRRASVPTLTFPDLPVTGQKAAIADLIQRHQVVILCGETGSGKTTQLPKICLEIGRGVAGFIGHTQPRRIAARTVANRIAEEVGESVGQSVGYKVRFHDRTHPASLVKLMTDGILLAETQNDPFLSHYDTLIIDEAHERSLNIDFLLGYLKWLLPKRPDLKVIVTSATIDTQRFSAHFNHAPVIEVSGRTYPVEVRYRPIEVNDDDEDDETTDDLQQAILDAVDELYRDLRGDILIFLSGEHEIRETTASLKKHHPSQYEILPLYSKLSVSEQERVFNPKGGKVRIVLATNVAETSLTVPNIRGVIDTGHARISRYSARSKIQRLPIERISQSSANQRAGRCGRVAEGICIRLYSREDYLARPLFTEPEIMRTNLSAVILQMTALNLGDIAAFPFIEPPNDKMIRDGKTSLIEVNALDKAGKLTDTGKQLAKFPTDPKLARMLIAAHEQVCLKEVSIIVAALSIQDPREKPADKMPQAQAKQAVFKHPESDFLSLLNLWNAFEAQKKKLSNNKLRKYCTDNFLSYMRMREWHDNHTQILQVIKGDLKMHPNENDASYDQIHRALLTGLLSNVGFRHEQYEYLGGRGLKFFIFPGSGLHKLRPKWIVAAEQVETSKVYARTVARVEPEWIEECAAHLVKHNYYDPHWEKKSARAMVYSRTLLHGLTLQAGRKLPFDHVDQKAAREMFIRSALVNHDYHSNAPFYVANQALLEEVGMIQHKGRRVDLVEDEQWLYAFYDHKLPAEIVSGAALDSWRKKIERENKRFLFLTKEDLTREQSDVFVNEWDFPDHKKVGKLTIALQYRFEPGHDEDGVTAIIPVHQLNQITQTPFDWLVPGMLEEKCVALVKSLPKALRKHFVPVPEMVKRCLEIEPDFKGALEEWLGMRLRKLTDEAIALTAWNAQALPAHLNMNFRVIDDEGQLLDYGRDLKALQAKHVTKAGESFDQIAADELNFTGYIQWAFEDLPAQYSFMQKGQAFVGYPALVDEGESVGVKIFDTEGKANVQHQAGLIRLFQLQQRKECTYALKNSPKNAALELAYHRLPTQALFTVARTVDFKDDVLSLVLRGVFVEGQTIRTQDAFEQCLRDNKAAFMSTMNSTVTLAFEILTLYSALKTLLQTYHATDLLANSVNQQLDYLIYAGFLREVPFAQLKHLPRYLKAMHYRLEKRDNTQTKANELARFQLRYWKSLEQRSKKEMVMPEREAFRWLLEEFAVSLFAQHLKTAVPVSAQRLEKAWEA